MVSNGEQLSGSGGQGERSQKCEKAGCSLTEGTCWTLLGQKTACLPGIHQAVIADGHSPHFSSLAHHDAGDANIPATPSAMTELSQDEATCAWSTMRLIAQLKTTVCPVVEAEQISMSVHLSG
jgi:hypothetical protein